MASFMQPMDASAGFGDASAGFGAAAQEQPSRMGQLAGVVRGLRNPVTAFFHLLFKTLAIIVYIFGGWFNVGFVNLFIVCILLLAFDFWTVKNVSGRLMVGLRWWSEVQEDGSTIWRYESQELESSSSFDYWVFWVGLFVPALVWSLFAIGSFFRFSFDWLLLILTALSLSGANIVGYVYCSRDASAQLSAGMQSVAAKTGMNAAMGSMMQSAAGKAFGFV